MAIGILTLYYLVFLFACALTLSYVLIAVLRRSPCNRFFSDAPNSRKLHETPVPRIGGLCIIISFVIATTIWTSLETQHIAFFDSFLSPIILACVVIVFGVGLLDDSVFMHLRIRYKLIFEFLLAVIAVALLNWNTGQIFLLSPNLFHPWVHNLFAVLWIVGIINAFNIIDGIDGLAGGVAIIGFAALGFLEMQVSGVKVLLLCTILIGCVAGFLIHNVSRKRVFLGDMGSLFLGAMTGVLSLHVVTVSSARISLPVLMLLVGLPVIDVFVAVVRRYFRARDRGMPFLRRFTALTIADNNHIHHRLINRGYSHLQTSFLLYLFSATFCCGALVIIAAPDALGLVILLYLTATTIVFLYRLGFGVRLKRAFIRSGDFRLSHEKPLFFVGITDSQGIIAHSLSETAPDIFMVIPLDKETLPAHEETLSALVICNESGTPLEEDMEIARRFSRRFARPAFLISEDIGSDAPIGGTGELIGLYSREQFTSTAIIAEEIRRHASPAPEIRRAPVTSHAY